MTLLTTWTDIDPAERRARLRELQVAVRLLAGPVGRALFDLLHRARAMPLLWRTAIES